MKELWNRLYFRKSQKFIENSLNAAQSDIFDAHSIEKAVNHMKHMEDIINDWTKKLSEKYDECNNILAHNYEEYYRGNRMFLKFIIVKTWVRLKYYTWIYFWYIKTVV